jgi:hypothetical protein
MCLAIGCTTASPPTALRAPALSPAAATRPAAVPAPLSFAIQLVDGKTRAILAGVTATVTRDAGTAAARAWDGRADAEGGVHVPPDMIADVLTVQVRGYRVATVNRHVGKRPKRVITVRLVPE